MSKNNNYSRGISRGGYRNNNNTRNNNNLSQGPTCYNCGQQGHIARNCAQTATESATTTVSSQEPYVDTHCHLEYVFQKLRIKDNKSLFTKLCQSEKFPANFAGCISVFCDAAALSPSLGMWQELLAEDKIWGVFGIHPHNAKYYTASIEERIVECLKHTKAVAWGETGLDYHYNHSEPEVQRKVFIAQILKAVELDKPLVVHSRSAADDTYTILKDYMPAQHKVHLHCFADNAQQAKRLITAFPNMYFGFTGAITFKNATDACEAVKQIPLNRILLETDAPYMAPHPLKGVSHSGHIPLIAQKIAELKADTLDNVLKTIRDNTRDMYGV